MKENNKVNNEQQGERKPAPKKPYIKYKDIDNIIDYLGTQMQKFKYDTTFYNDRDKEVELLKEYLHTKIDEDYQSNVNKSKSVSGPSNEDEVRLLKAYVDLVQFDVYYGTIEEDVWRRRPGNIDSTSRYIEVNDANHDSIDQLIKINELIRQYNQSPVIPDLCVCKYDDGEVDVEYDNSDIKIFDESFAFEIASPFTEKHFELTFGDHSFDWFG